MERDTRHLTDTERAALDAMLLLEFDGVAELRKQAQHARARRSCGCGCGTIALEVDKTAAPRSSTDHGVAPVDADFGDETEETGGLILFLDDGWLAELEVWYVGDDPVAMPDASKLRIQHRSEPKPPTT